VIFVLFVIFLGMFCAGRYGSTSDTVPIGWPSIITHVVD
jgi:hypothetical protein